MTDQRDSTEPPPPFERLDWFRERCTGRCAAMTMHKRKAGTTGGECATCGAKLPSAGATNGHAVDLAGASVAHAGAAAVAIAQSLPERAEPDLLCVHCARPRSAHFSLKVDGANHERSGDYCDLLTRRRFEASTAAAQVAGPIAPTALETLSRANEAVRTPLGELQQQLADMTADRDRWAARVKLLEAERDEAVRILQGLRR